MLFQSHPIEPGRRDFDLCIIGAGAAGITLAREMASLRDLRIAVLESGALQPDARTQALYDGEATGTLLADEDAYLTASRVRVFGGSTWHWNGWCLPLDRMDFEKRSWVPHSGWPIGEDELAGYYPKAASLLETHAFDPEADSRRSGTLDLDRSRIETRFFHFSRPTRFGVRYRDALVGAENVYLFLHANVVDLELDESGSRVGRVSVATLAGQKFSVAAKRFVLATGGIENPRILLASNRQHADGIGNGNDLVGRYFMEHPHIDGVGSAVLSNPSASLAIYDVALSHRRERREVGLLFPSPALRREARLLNVALQLIDFQPQSPSDSGPEGALARMDRDAPIRRSPVARGQRYPTPLVARIDVRCEQSPNPDSRVTLSDERDALGMPRARLEWRLGDLERDTIHRFLEITASELGRRSLGRLRLRIPDTNPWRGGYGGSHHMGTTRMADTPAQGVVDANCRVFDVENLYVAGSSVFPTVGVANPTFTIVALALRLADHLKGRFAAGRATPRASDSPPVGLA